MPPASRGSFLSLFLRHNIKIQSSSSSSLRRYATAIDLEVPFAPPKIKLREYQEEAIQAVLSHLREGHKRLGLSLATGSGKTVIFTQLIDRITPKSPDADQTIILAHRRELVEQAAKHCRSAYPDKSIGIEQGVHHATGKEDIIVASMQSIISGERMEKFDPKRFKLVLVDEAHHIVSNGYMRTLAYFGLDQAREESPALVGVSATLSRFDGLKLGAAMDHIAYHKDYIDMIGEKWLSDVSFTTVQSGADITKVRLSSGDFQASELSKQVNTDQVNEITVRAWMHKAATAKSTIVFCADLDHVSGLTNKFRKHGFDARFVSGFTPKKERSDLLDDFKAGKFPVLVNCGVFTEGTDIPNIDCVLLARPTKSRNLLIQMIGRGMRLHPGKTVCHIIDLVASLEAGIVSVPSLFGLDPGEVLDGASVTDMKKLQEQKEEKKPTGMQEGSTSSSHRSISTNISFTDYNDVFEFLEDNNKEKHIRQLSPHTWVEVGLDKYVLQSTPGYLILEKQPPQATESTEEEYIVTVTQRLPIELKTPTTKSPYLKPRELVRTTSFTDALHAADTYASKRYPANLISKRQAKWREYPATPGQLVFLNKLRGREEQWTAQTLKKGKAGDLITKLKFGGRGRFAKVEKERRRMGVAREKVERRERRERVGVGPILD